MDQEEIDKVVVACLDKRGFKQAGLGFQHEKQQNNKSSNASSTAQIDPDIAKQILAFSEVDGPAQYQEGYSKLRSWAYSSLDQYQHELVRVLYPVFIHAFMDLVAKGHIQEARSFFNSFREDHEVHARDLQKLEGVFSPSHLEEMEFAHSLRQSKVNIKICQYSYDLLLQYLHKSQSIIMLGIINEHINFQVSPGQPTSIADDAEFVTLFGSEHDAANLINQKEIQWGDVEVEIRESRYLSKSLDALRGEKMTTDVERGEEDEESASELLRDRFRLCTISIAEAEAKRNGMEVSQPIMTCISDLAFKYAQQLAKDLELFAQHAGRKSVNMEDVILSAHRNDHLAASLRSFCNELKAKEPQPDRKRKKVTKKEDKAATEVLHIGDP